MAEADARARIAAQASDDARRAAADVVLDNGGVARGAATPPSTRCGTSRLVPFEANLRTDARCRPRADPVDAGPAVGGRRRPARAPGSPAAAGPGARDVAHVGPTAVPGLPAVDVLDLQVGVDPASSTSRARWRRSGPVSTPPASPGRRPATPRGSGGTRAPTPAGRCGWRCGRPGRRRGGRPCCGATGCGPTRAARAECRDRSAEPRAGGVCHHPSGGVGRIVGVDAVVGGAAGTVNGHVTSPTPGRGLRSGNTGSRHSMEWATRPTAPFDPRSTVTGPRFPGRR